MLFGKQLCEILISHGSATHSSAGGRILWPLTMADAAQSRFLLCVQGSPGAADQTGVPKGPKNRACLEKVSFFLFLSPAALLRPAVRRRLRRGERRAGAEPEPGDRREAPVLRLCPDLAARHQPDELPAHGERGWSSPAAKGGHVEAGTGLGHTASVCLKAALAVKREEI